MNILMAFRIECVTAVAAAAVVVASRRRHLKRLSPFGVLYPKEYLRQATWTLTSRARHLSISPFVRQIAPSACQFRILPIG
ncbi:hypothetical protein RB195_008043 [Necator americanus]